MLKKNIPLFSLIILGLFFIGNKASAVCPVCTIAVGAGVGFSRWLGIDDTIIGLWIGGLTVSLIIWTINWFNKKTIAFQGRDIVTVLGYFALVVAPLYPMGIIGHPFNTFWGIDKLLLGVILGSAFFFLGARSYDWLKVKYGKAWFPFQKVAMPIIPLIVLSILFYFITK